MFFSIGLTAPRSVCIPRAKWQSGVSLHFAVWVARYSPENVTANRPFVKTTFRAAASDIVEGHDNNSFFTSASRRHSVWDWSLLYYLESGTAFKMPLTFEVTGRSDFKCGRPLERKAHTPPQCNSFHQGKVAHPIVQHDNGLHHACRS